MDNLGYLLVVLVGIAVIFIGIALYKVFGDSIRASMSKILRGRFANFDLNSFVNRFGALGTAVVLIFILGNFLVSSSDQGASETKGKEEAIKVIDNTTKETADEVVPIKAPTDNKVIVKKQVIKKDSTDNTESFAEKQNREYEEELAKLEKDIEKQRKKQVANQLAADKARYDSAMRSLKNDCNRQMNSLESSEQNAINSEKARQASGGTGGSEQEDQAIDRIKDYYDGQYEYVENVCDSELNAIEATKYW